MEMNLQPASFFVSFLDVKHTMGGGAKLHRQKTVLRQNLNDIAYLRERVNLQIRLEKAERTLSVYLGKRTKTSSMLFTNSMELEH